MPKKKNNAYRIALAQRAMPGWYPNRDELDSMSNEEINARAKAVINNTWKKTSFLFGKQGQPMPNYEVNNTLTGNNRFGEVNPSSRQIALDPRTMRMLASKPRSKDKTKNRRAIAQTILLHELAHAYQNPGLMNDATDNYAHREDAAQLFATFFGHKLFGGPNMRQFEGENRKKVSRRLAGGYGKGYWRKRQFEE